MLALERGYYSMDRGGFRFVILDPNYFCNEPGRFIHQRMQVSASTTAVTA